MSETTLTNLQHQALKILIQDTSEKRPITGLNLSKRIGLKQRTGEEGSNLRQIIHALRVKGFPICAYGRGYFYARTTEQLSKFIANLQARLISQEEALDGLKGAFHNVGDMAPLKSWMPEVKKEVVIRTPEGLAKKIKVDVDTNGNPIIPAGMKVI